MQGQLHAPWRTIRAQRACTLSSQSHVPNPSQYHNFSLYYVATRCSNDTASVNVDVVHPDGARCTIRAPAHPDIWRRLRGRRRSFRCDIQHPLETCIKLQVREGIRKLHRCSEVRRRLLSRSGCALRVFPIVPSARRTFQLVRAYWCHLSAAFLVPALAYFSPFEHIGHALCAVRHRRHVQAPPRGQRRRPVVGVCAVQEPVLILLRCKNFVESHFRAREERWAPREYVQRLPARVLEALSQDTDKLAVRYVSRNQKPAAPKHIRASTFSSSGLQYHGHPDLVGVSSALVAPLVQHGGAFCDPMVEAVLKLVRRNRGHSSHFTHIKLS